MSLNKFLAAAAAVVPVFIASAANAALITDFSALATTNTTVTAFGPPGQYTSGYSQVITGSNPLAMTYNGSSGLYVDYNSSWGLGTNGDIVPGTPSMGINQGGSLTFVLQNGPISGFGFLMNYAPGFGPVSILALDASLNPFQTYDITTAAPIVGLPFQFRGIQDAAADIYGFELLAGPNSNASPLIDSISYTAAITDVPVPEPMTIALVLSGLGAMGAVRRRKK